MARSRKREKPKGVGKGAGNLKEATVLVPLTYNDGTQVPRAILLSIFDEMYAAFHGWTDEGVVKGAYRMRTGQKRTEDLLKVSVILDEPRVSELEGMISRWGAKLGQETMLLKIADSDVKFIPPLPEEEQP